MNDDDGNISNKRFSSKYRQSNDVSSWSISNSKTTTLLCGTSKN